MPHFSPLLREVGVSKDEQTTSRMRNFHEGGISTSEMASAMVMAACALHDPNNATGRAAALAEMQDCRPKR